MARLFVFFALATTLGGCGFFESGSDKADSDPNAVRIVATEVREVRGDYATFHTEKDIRPPAIDVLTEPADGTSGDHIFLTPRAPDPDTASGPTILDSRGRLVYQRPIENRVTANLLRHEYKGRPAMSWGERPPVTAPPELFELDPKDTFHVIYDETYNEVGRVQARGEGVITDMHELTMTERDTAFVIGNRKVPLDLTEFGGAPDGELVEQFVQEIDPDSGKVLFNWSVRDHIPLTDSMFPAEPKIPWDAYHVNTISFAPDGDLLVTLRHTSAVYKVDRKSGKIEWTLGGKSSDFELGSGVEFFFAHDARFLRNGNLLIFDNGATYEIRRRPHSRVIEVALDEKRRRATLVDEIVHDPPILVVSQGGARELENGNIFVGWGNRQWFSEYTRHGQVLFDAALPSVAYQSYRALKAPWKARPGGAPKIVADHTRGNRTLIWASWNGATEIARWRVLGGKSAQSLAVLGTAPWEGFETKLDVARRVGVVQVEALDAEGNVLGRSGALPVGD